jgi:transposase-like protein
MLMNAAMEIERAKAIGAGPYERTRYRKVLQTLIFQHLKDLFNAPSYEMAMFQKKEVLKKYDKAAPKLVEWLDENLDQAMTFFQFPRQLWKRIRSTNIVERFTREIRRRTRVFSIFPGEKSVFRLAGSLLIEIHEEWIAAPKYLNYESIAELNAEDGIYRTKVA